jgi:hypothetical protein
MVKDMAVLPAPVATLEMRLSQATIKVLAMLERSLMTTLGKTKVEMERAGAGSESSKVVAAVMNR